MTLIFKDIKDYGQGAGVAVRLLCDGAQLDEAGQRALEALGLKAGQVEMIRALEEEKLHTTLYALLPQAADYDALEKLVAEVAGRLKALKATQVDLLLEDAALAPLSGALYKQLHLMGDGFERSQGTGWKPITGQEQAPEKEAFQPRFTVYLPEGMEVKQEQQKAEAARAVAEGIRIARRLVNEPANIMSPIRLAAEAAQLSRQHGFSIEVYDEKQIEQLGLEAFLSVAKGSDAPPRFLVMRYMNQPGSDQLLALVGKGLTYDSGGYALKQAAGMATMFCDMAGAAAVIGAISTLAIMKAPVNVVAVVAACENMVSGRAYRNGDIIGSLSGKQIEVANTDAEGRLTLADAICYAATVLKADRIIDIATLTGAVVVALGDRITGLVADDEGIVAALNQASAESGDKLWRLPHFEHLAEQNKSDRADIKNSGGRLAGTATGALFCRAFAAGVPWAHLDIAGTAYQEKASAKAPLGATGVGAELLARAAITLFE